MSHIPKKYAPYEVEFAADGRSVIKYEGKPFVELVPKPEAEVKLMVDMLNTAYSNGVNTVAAQLEPVVEAQAAALQTKA